MSGLPLAHVKWFSEFSFADRPVALAEAVSPTLIGLALLSMVTIGALVFLDVRLGQLPAYQGINRWLSSRSQQSVLVMRIGAGAVLLLSWQADAMLVPELHIGAAWVGWFQFLLALLLLFRRTTPAAGMGLIGLFALGVVCVGAFHMLDYALYAGAGYFLGVSNARDERIRASGLPVLYLAVGFSLCWVALEKIVYPQWGLYVLQQNPQLALGLPLRFFLLAAAFVEFSLGYLLIINLLQRPMALLITLVFFTTTLIFGKTEVVGHTLIHAALIVFLLEGPGTIYRPPIAFHRRLPLRTAFASVNFALLFAVLLPVYGTVAMRRYRATVPRVATEARKPAGFPASTLLTASYAGALPMITDPLERYRWKNRPLLVFAPSESDARGRVQRRHVEGERAGFGERDMILLELWSEGGSRAGGEPLREADVAVLRARFGVGTDEFAVILVGKDGGEKGRWTDPVELSRVFALIDGMPMRRREMRREGE